MKFKINKIVPILVTIFLPGIGFFLSDGIPKNSLPVVYQWIYTSFTLYSLWLLLAFSWRYKPLYKQLIFLVINISLFLLIVSFISYATGQKEDFSFEAKEFIRMLFLISIFLTIQYNIESQKQIAGLKVEKEQLSKENYKAQLQSLRNQIDPHFLFNSLNTLRSMVRQNHKDSEDFILSLSDFYRSTLKHHEESSLSLTEEFAFLNSYLHLMKSRNEEAVQFEIAPIEAKYGSLRLPSFALQNVVENCFKHNSMSSKKPLHIQIVCTPDNYIEVSNTIQEKLTQPQGTSTGLTLLKKRYQLLGENQGVIISKSDGKFKVKLKLIHPNEHINS